MRRSPPATRIVSPRRSRCSSIGTTYGGSHPALVHASVTRNGLGASPAGNRGTCRRRARGRHRGASRSSRPARQRRSAPVVQTELVEMVGARRRVRVTGIHLANRSSAAARRRRERRRRSSRDAGVFSQWSHQGGSGQPEGVGDRRCPAWASHRSRSASGRAARRSSGRELCPRVGPDAPTRRHRYPGVAGTPMAASSRCRIGPRDDELRPHRPRSDGVKHRPLDGPTTPRPDSAGGRHRRPDSPTSAPGRPGSRISARSPTWSGNGSASVRRTCRSPRGRTRQATAAEPTCRTRAPADPVDGATKFRVERSRHHVAVG